MTDHDWLCWRKQDYVAICSMCVLIASVRADERERIAQAIEALPTYYANQWYVLQESAAQIAREGGGYE